MSDKYEGVEKLILGIDIGATQSAVAFLHLKPGERPTPSLVTKWPDQPVADAKLPSCVLYRDDKAVAFGVTAEALRRADEGADHPAGDFVRHFKLHLHPEHLRKAAAAAPVTPRKSKAEPSVAPLVERVFELPDLPKRIGIRKVYADFIRFLVDSSGAFFSQTRVGGAATWSRLIKSAEYIFGVPNGWNESQQSVLKEALMSTGLCSNLSSITCVSEGEASLHYLLNLPASTLSLKPGMIFTVCDAGGSTIDMTMYRCEDAESISLREVKGADCLQRGGIYVSRVLKTMIRDKLGSSDYRRDVDEIITNFDNNLKLRYIDEANKGGHEIQRIQFARPRDNDREHGVVAGYMTVSSNKVKDAFNFCVIPLIERVKSHLADLDGNPVSAVILVGGFGDSPFVQRHVQTALEEKGIQLITPAEPGKKAVAVGAACFWLHKDKVKARAAQFHFGIKTAFVYDESDPEHRLRVPFEHADGQKYADGCFSILLQKDVVTTNSEYQKHGFARMYHRRSDLPSIPFEVTLLRCRDEASPVWSEKPDGSYCEGVEEVGTLSCDPDSIRKTMKQRSSRDGKTYFEANFNVMVSFGGTHLSTYLESSDGSSKGKATFIPNRL